MSFIDTEQDLYNKLVKEAAGLAGLTVKEIEYAMDAISYHEAGKGMDPLQKQFGDGPGRGLFQYEIVNWKDSKGNPSSGAGRTAMNRLYSYLGGNLLTGVEPKYMPGFVSDANQRQLYKNKEGNVEKWWARSAKYANGSNEFDATHLSGQQQKILFLADKIQDKSIAQMGKKSLASWWLDHHNKTQGTLDRAKRKVSFIFDNMHYDANEIIEDGINIVSNIYRQEYGQDIDSIKTLTK